MERFVNAGKERKELLPHTGPQGVGGFLITPKEVRHHQTKRPISVIFLALGLTEQAGLDEMP